MISNLTEQLLVARGKTGDHAAFTELVRRNSMVAMRAVRNIAPNPADTEDVMQETLLKAYTGLPMFNEGCKFSTWLTQIAINNALQLLRRQKRRSEINLDTETGLGDWVTVQFADIRPNPETRVIRDQTVKIVRRAVDALPAQLRQYARRRHFDEQAHGAVSSSLGISLAAGKSRSMRAHRRLETMLAGLSPGAL